MGGTIVKVGSVELDDAEWHWPLSRDGEPPRIVIKQGAQRAAELAAIPWRTEISFTCNAVEGGAEGGDETLVIGNVRRLEVRVISDLLCELHLGNCLSDIAARICPSDFLMRWKDGLLDGTNKKTLREAVESLALLVPEVKDNLAADAFDNVPTTTDYELPEGLVLSGTNMLNAIDRCLESIGVSRTVTSGGYLRFVGKKDLDDAAPPTSPYSWLIGLEPSWEAQSRKLGGLPKVIRCPYWERHAMLVEAARANRTATPTNALEIVLTQVYALGERFLTLAELMEELGFTTNPLTDDQICAKILTDNFEGTCIERQNGIATDKQTETAITVIKRDWRQLYRLEYPNNIGRRGGWTDIAFGYFRSATDKDGHTVYANDVTGASVFADYTELFLGGAPQHGDQISLANVLVARSYVSGSAQYPGPAPFTPQWVNEAEGIVRLVHASKEGDTNPVYLGRMMGEDTRYAEDVNTPVLDSSGASHGSVWNLRFPAKGSIKFRTNQVIKILMVATRRLPNDATKWTAFDTSAFADGDLEVMELEVPPDRFALRDFVGQTRNEFHLAAPDGFGQLLNSDDLRKDAEARARIVIERLKAAPEGTGTAQGVAFAQDNQVEGAIREIRICVDETVVTTEVDVGNLDNALARYERKLKRDAARTFELGGRKAL